MNDLRKAIYINCSENHFRMMSCDRLNELRKAVIDASNEWSYPALPIFRTFISADGSTWRTSDRLPKESSQHSIISACAPSNNQTSKSSTEMEMGENHAGDSTFNDASPSDKIDDGTLSRSLVFFMERCGFTTRLRSHLLSHTNHRLEVRYKALLRKVQNRVPGSRGPGRPKKETISNTQEM